MAPRCDYVFVMTRRSWSDHGIDQVRAIRPLTRQGYMILTPGIVILNLEADATELLDQEIMILVLEIVIFVLEIVVLVLEIGSRVLSPGILMEIIFCLGLGRFSFAYLVPLIFSEQLLLLTCFFLWQI